MKKAVFCSVLLMMLMFLPGAGPLRAQGNLVSLDLKDVPLETAMQQIKQQTNYLFVNMNVDTQQKVSARVDRKGIDTALDALLSPIHVDWKIEGTTIVIAPKVQQAVAGPRTVRGRILDAAGQPVIGCAVMVKGTTIGASTDLDGNFEFSVPDGYENRTLEFSSLGYSPVELSIGNRSVFNVILEEETEMLEGTVVTALGIRRAQKALSYNVQEIKSDEILTNKDANFINSLNGKVAGLVMNNSSSGVGGATKVVMRGLKSINQGSNAIYVIDGVPMTASTQTAETVFGSAGATDPIADLNPEDIESISVLTGAAAAALYGSSAANGAIVITTKTGSSEKTTITLTSNTEVSRVATLPRFQDWYGTGDTNSSEGSTVRSYGDKITGSRYTQYDPAHDYFQYGLTGTESISLSTGTDRNKTYLSGSAVNSRGIIPNNAYNRYNAKFRNTAKFFNNKLTLDVSAENILQGNRNMRNQGTYYNPVVSAYLFPRGSEWADIKMFERWDSARKIYTQYWPAGDGGITMQNPYWINYRNLLNVNRKRYILSGSLSWDILSWLNLSGRVKVDNGETRSSMNNYATTNTQLTGSSNKGNFEDKVIGEGQTYADVLLSANKSFAKWSLNINLGASVNDKKYTSLSYGGPIDPELGIANKFDLNNVTQDRLGHSQSAYHDQIQSVYGQAELGFMGAYYLTVTGRNDWDSALAGPRSLVKSFFYPSVGLSVVLSQALTLPRQIEFLKIRASYADVGNAFARWIANPLHEYSGTSKAYLSETAYPMDNLKPERTSSWEVGLQSRLLDGFSLNLTWYDTHTKDQTLYPAISSGSGYSSIAIQTGDAQNTGVELSLGYTHTWGRFGWTSDFAFSHNRNKIVSLIGDAKNPITGELLNIDNMEMGGFGAARFYLVEGGSMGDLYSRSELVRDNRDKIYVDPSGNVQSKTITDFGSMLKLGNVLPKANLSWRNEFRYGNLSASALVTARLGGVVFSRTQAMLDWFGVSENSALARDNGGVLVNGGDYVDANKWYSVIGGGDTVPQYYTYSATNVRLQEAAIGYTIPRKSLGGLFDLTLQLVGRNLWMIYCKAPFDPEAVASTTDDYYQGIDNFMTPTTRNVGFNVRLNF